MSPSSTAGAHEDLCHLLTPLWMHVAWVGIFDILFIIKKSNLRPLTLKGLNMTGSEKQLSADFFY